MHRDVVVPLLKAVELLDVVQVVAPDDDGPLHLGAHAHALQDGPADAHVPGEGALLVHEVALLGLLGRREAKAHRAPVPHRLLGLLGQQPLGADEDGVLLLKRLLGLIHGGVFWPLGLSFRAGRRHLVCA